MIPKQNNVTELWPSTFQVTLDHTLGQLSRILDHDHFVLITHSQKLYSGEEGFTSKEVIVGIATRIDLLNYVTNNQQPSI